MLQRSDFFGTEAGILRNGLRRHRILQHARPVLETREVVQRPADLVHHGVGVNLIGNNLIDSALNSFAPQETEGERKY